MIGLIVFGGAAISFVFSNFFGPSIFWFYLLLLFVIGCGLTCLEVAANPYVTLLGDPQTAASRINRAQSFNGLGCICGSLLGGIYCFSSDDPNISFPYILIGITVILVAILFSRVKLPEFVIEDKLEQTKTVNEQKSILQHPLFLFGLFALFCYEVAEIAINSFYINYAIENHMAEWIGNVVEQIFQTTLNPKFIASIVLSIGLFLFMCGRFLGSWIMSFIRAEKILLVCAIGTVITTTLVMLDIHIVSFVSSMLIFIFESIMFPTIFALSIKNLGNLTQKASAVLMMTPIGGAVGTVLMGMAADHRDMTFSFLVPLIAFVVVFGYSAILVFKQKST